MKGSGWDSPLSARGGSVIPLSVGEGSNVISRYMDYFLLKGVLERERKGTYRFIDPVFKEWLKRKLIPTDL